MDGKVLPVTSDDFYARIGTAAAPLVIDVRRQDAFNAADKLIIGAFYRSPDEVERWRTISYGLSANFSDDHEMLKHGMIVYDALYTWCRMQTRSSAPAKSDQRQR
jgi:uncharacterized protein with von Willebrand factor type A (vWA) domain